ncbi:MAG: hypothetical protein V3V14_13485 [Saprospiraceae bacterium]
MNIKKVEKQLKKINQLMGNINEEGTVSAIERDLLLSYLRDLYEKVLKSDNEEDLSVEQKSVKYQNGKIEDLVIKAPKVEMSEVVKKELVEAEIPEAVAVKTRPIPAQNLTSIDSYKTDDVEIPTLVAEPSISAELEEIFNEIDVKELSDKIGQRPVSDLTKCMGINERIFTVKELFNNDTALFNKTMLDLNKLNNYDDAKSYLIKNIAITNNWGEKSKIKKANKFVKLISRRYN